MATCINPRWHRYYDPFDGQERCVQFGCGKCANCLAAEQDSWAIRINESVQHSKGFVYETLTFRTEALRQMSVDVSDAVCDSDFLVSPEVASLLDYWGEALGPYNLPLFEKSLLSQWIKRGREAYFRDKGVRCDIKYLFCMEYGPKYSRPHAHGIVIGISYGDYLRYFSKPWRVSYGFTKPKWVASGRHGYVKSCCCISRYVSKYVNKGFFESPLVKNGLLPKCWRMVSNGIGKEYLQSSRFQSFSSGIFQDYKKHFHRFEERREFSGESYTVRRRTSNRLFNACCYVGSRPLLKFSEDDLNKLISYVDDSGYYHSLPRYYRESILGRDSSLAKYSVQVALLAYARKRYTEKLQRIASSFELAGTYKGLCESYGLSSVPCKMYLASYFLCLAEKQKAIREEKRHFLTMKNHYLRPKRGNLNYVQLNQ